MVYSQLIINSKYTDLKTGEITETQNVKGRSDYLSRLIDRLGDEIIQDLGKYTSGGSSSPVITYRKNGELHIIMDLD